MAGKFVGESLWKLEIVYYMTIHLNDEHPKYIKCIQGSETLKYLSVCLMRRSDLFFVWVNDERLVCLHHLSAWQRNVSAGRSKLPSLTLRPSCDQGPRRESKKRGLFTPEKHWIQFNTYNKTCWLAHYFFVISLSLTSGALYFFKSKIFRSWSQSYQDSLKLPSFLCAPKSLRETCFVGVPSDI